MFEHRLSDEDRDLYLADLDLTGDVMDLWIARFPWWMRWLDPVRGCFEALAVWRWLRSNAPDSFAFVSRTSAKSRIRLAAEMGLSTAVGAKLFLGFDDLVARALRSAGVEGLPRTGVSIASAREASDSISLYPEPKGSGEWMSVCGRLMKRARLIVSLPMGAFRGKGPGAFGVWVELLQMTKHLGKVVFVMPPLPKTVQWYAWSDLWSETGRHHKAARLEWPAYHNNGMVFMYHGGRSPTCVPLPEKSSARTLRDALDRLISEARREHEVRSRLE